MGYYYGDVAGWGMGGGLMMIFFWAAFIVFIVWIVRELGAGRHSETPTRHSHSALDILKERYAKGEIEKSEFEAKKKDLQD